MLVGLVGKKQFTSEGVEQLKKAVSKRNSGDMTELDLKIPDPPQENMTMPPTLLPIADYT